MTNGWRLNVNGNNREILEVSNGLMGISLEKGTHIITLEYWPPKFFTGLYISLFTLLLLLLFIHRKKYFDF